MSQMLYQSPAIERLGIPAYNWWNGALHGVARAGVATMFPQAIGLAATFDRELIQEIGDVVSTEGRAKFNEFSRRGDHGIYKGLTFWAPNVNIFRDPRWGRGHETYGEDPYLTGELGCAYIKGLQGPDPEHPKAAACAKHFAVHSGPEALRHQFNAQVSKHDLYDTYLYAFKRCVKDAKVEAVMGAYNRVNGEPACGSKGLQNGLEKISKILMSALLIMIVVLAVHSFTLSGAGEGIRFYLIPNLKTVKEVGFGNVVSAAMNQAFFTLSLGVAAMEIFGSYMGKYHTLAGEGLRICALDTFVAIMAGLIIFPAGSIPPGNSQILQQSCYTKNHLSAKIELFRLLFNERKGDFNGKSNKFYGTYKMDVQVSHCICNDIFNHTSLCEFHQGKLLLHLTIPFEEKPKTNLPSDNLRYYRQRKQMTTRQLAEKLNIVPATIVMYENGKHPIPYDVSIKLADVLEIEASLLYDDFSRFLAVPYTEALKSVRTALGLSQKAFAEQIGIVPSYYYKIEEGNRRPSRKVYQKICAALEATGRQTSLLWAQPLQ